MLRLPYRLIAAANVYAGTAQLDAVVQAIIAQPVGTLAELLESDHDEETALAVYSGELDGVVAIELPERPRVAVDADVVQRRRLAPHDRAPTEMGLDVGVMRGHHRDEGLTQPRGRLRPEVAHSPHSRRLYREASCASVSLYDGEGERLSTVRMARMPESKKVTLKTMVGAEVEAVLGQRPDLQLVKIAVSGQRRPSY